MTFDSGAEHVRCGNSSDRGEGRNELCVSGDRGEAGRPGRGVGRHAGAGALGALGATVSPQGEVTLAALQSGLPRPELRGLCRSPGRREWPGHQEAARQVTPASSGEL